MNLCIYQPHVLGHSCAIVCLGFSTAKWEIPYTLCIVIEKQITNAKHAVIDAWLLAATQQWLSLAKMIAQLEFLNLSKPLHPHEQHRRTSYLSVYEDTNCCEGKRLQDPSIVDSFGYITDCHKLSSLKYYHLNSTDQKLRRTWLESLLTVSQSQNEDAAQGGLLLGSSVH